MKLCDRSTLLTGGSKVYEISKTLLKPGQLRSANPYQVECRKRRVRALSGQDHQRPKMIPRPTTNLIGMCASHSTIPTQQTSCINTTAYQKAIVTLNYTTPHKHPGTRQLPSGGGTPGTLIPTAWSGVGITRGHSYHQTTVTEISPSLNP